MFFRYLLPAALLAGASLCNAALAADETAIPAEQFFKNPAMTGARLSPDGRYVAVRKLSPHGRSMLAIVDIAARQSKSIASFGNADIGNFFWMSNQRLGFTATNVDHKGDIGKPGLFIIDRDGTNLKPVTEVLEAKRSFAEGARTSSCCISNTMLRGFETKGDHIFAQMVYEDDKSTSLIRIDTSTGRYDKIATPDDTDNWLADPGGKVRIATARRDKTIFIFHADEKGKWRKIHSYEENTDAGFQPLLYLDGIIYVLAPNGKDEAAIYRYDIQKNALESQPLITAPGFDTKGEFVLDDKKMLGFRFTTDAEVTVWFDHAMKAAQQEVDQLLPGTVNSISRGDASETPYVLVDAYSAIQDHIYLLYDTAAKKQILLGQSRPDMEPGKMADMFMERYPARDGMRIPAFVTLPKSGPQKKLPTVVLVGKQPWQRNAQWEWNAEVQFLASRGYVVLQPEPRGEAGFGLRHRRAGEEQWGRAIQDDIADAVKWAVAQGYTDPARVCIAGTGYGGYAAMMALLNHGDLYQCGITWSGKIDFSGTPRATPPQELSPLKNAARIKQPVLLAYGTEDSKADYKQGRKFYEAVSSGNPHAEWLSYKPSVEDWKTQQNRIDLWRRIEAFLARHIGAK